MKPTDKPESERATAERLTAQLGTDVGRGQVRWWKVKGFDLQDLDSLRHSIRNQQRGIKLPKPKPSLGDLPVEYVAEIQRKNFLALIGFVAAMEPETPADEIAGGIALACYDIYSKGFGELLGDAADFAAEVREVPGLKR